MELHHLRRFVILAEELHFTRAAERLHIEQSPLSRNIRELEDDLGVTLFQRDRRGTRLTSAGRTLLKEARRLLSVMEQVRENVKAVASGLRGSLHIAVSDGVIDPRLSAFLARCREEEPETEIHLSEVTLSEQLRGLRCGDFVLGLACTAEVGEGITTESIWQDALLAAIPIRHPLLTHKAIALPALVDYPLILYDPQQCEGQYRELIHLLRPLEGELNIIEYATSQDMMLALVGAGYGIGFITANRFALCRCPHVIIRRLKVDSAVLTTYLLRPREEPSPALLDRFASRLHDCVTPHHG